jgi:hypothetical protein
MHIWPMYSYKIIHNISNNKQYEKDVLIKLNITWHNFFENHGEIFLQKLLAWKILVSDTKPHTLYSNRWVLGPFLDFTPRLFFPSSFSTTKTIFWLFEANISVQSPLVKNYPYHDFQQSICPAEYNFIFLSYIWSYKQNNWYLTGFTS